jgi:hypothetical protein
MYRYGEICTLLLLLCVVCPRRCALVDTERRGQGQVVPTRDRHCRHEVDARRVVCCEHWHATAAGVCEIDDDSRTVGRCGAAALATGFNA